MEKLIKTIEDAWDGRATITPGDWSAVAIGEALSLLDRGDVRIAEKNADGWRVNTWLKKAVLLSFRISENKMIEGGPWYDKVPLKFAKWSKTDFEKSGIRAVPGSFVRYGAYIAPGVVLMPSFVNIGAYVGEGTMVDTWATVGSCAQIGKNCHISGGSGIGGVLEPVQADPVIIEDNCFIGARSEVAEGMLVEEGAVLSMGVYLGKSTPILDRASGEISFGKIPAYSVVIPGILPEKNTYAAVIVKKVDAGTRAKTSINDLLRP
ncbi:MAG: 2,3,4,5-tetrahydropyridine-2,6-dicarboxylate N-succinyltransferase [Sphingomonadales bacterium]